MALVMPVSPISSAVATSTRPESTGFCTQTFSVNGDTPLSANPTPPTRFPRVSLSCRAGGLDGDSAWAGLRRLCGRSPADPMRMPHREPLPTGRRPPRLSLLAGTPPEKSQERKPHLHGSGEFRQGELSHPLLSRKCNRKRAVLTVLPLSLLLYRWAGGRKISSCPGNSPANERLSQPSQ